MAYSSFLQEKARELNISLNKPSDQLLVYKRVLEGMRQLFRGDLRKVTNSIDTLEKDLREICNELDDIVSSGEAVNFIHQKQVKSINGILSQVEIAYSHIFTVSKMLDEGGSDAYFAAADHLRNCRHALQKAIQEFCIQ